MTFDYQASGLPQSPRWEMAAAMCFDWLDKHMPMFRGEGIQNFMRDQPVAAAQRLIQNVPGCSEELVTLALLGPARSSIQPHLADPVVSGFVTNAFGARTTTLMLASMDLNHAKNDPQIVDDLQRLFIVEGISTMTDQMIGRQKKDAFHEKRWNILAELEVGYSGFKGKNPGLDELFVEAVQQSKLSLKALEPQDRPQLPKGPR